MVTKKDMTVAILATFCLTSTLFMITISKSQSGVGEYNPWADYNEDGVIDIFDIVPAATSFGTEGDSTRNVNVANWPQDISELRLVYNQSCYLGVESGWVYLTTANVTGFKTMQIHAKAIGPQEGVQLRIWVCYDAYGVTSSGDDFALDFPTYTSVPWYGCGRTDTVFTRSDSIKIYITTTTRPVNITLLTIAVYLQN